MQNKIEIIDMTADIVSAYVGNNTVGASDLPDLIQQVHSALNGVTAEGAGRPQEPLKPAVSIKKSITPDYLICLEDGKKLKMLKRHLKTAYDMTPDDYRERWGLPSDYPMVAPNYAAQRSEFAKKIGLGRKKSQRTPRRSRRG